MVFALRFSLYSSAAVGAFGAAHLTPGPSGNWAGAENTCIKVTPDKQDDWAKHDVTYPSNYANTCEMAGAEPGSYHCTWVKDHKAAHVFVPGYSYNSKWNSETWCSDKFCWVDPCACNTMDIAKSSWLNGHYSYSMCGAKDKYTPVSCDVNKDETTCKATEKCKWDTTCKAMTGAEAMVALRTKLNCPDPTKVPTTCACSANKEAKVDCNAANKKLWDGSVNKKSVGNWGGAVDKCIKVTPDKDEPWAKHDFTYPANYANTCDQSGKEPGSYHCTWVKDKKTTHKFAVGATYNSKWDSETWCSDKFCWVDPCACNKLDVSKSSWLNGHYSYSMCGSTDKYTPVACDVNTDETKCKAAKGCKWDTTCKAMTGEEAMVALRTELKCAEPTKVPTTCACKANAEAQISCDAANKMVWTPQPGGPQPPKSPTDSKTTTPKSTTDAKTTSGAFSAGMGMSALLLISVAN